MHSPNTPANLRACDAVAVAMEEHIRSLESDGHGDLVIERLDDGINIAFGNVKVRAENYDIALVRLAGALLDDARLGGHFLERLRLGKLSSLIRSQQSEGPQRRGGTN